MGTELNASAEEYDFGFGDFGGRLIRWTIKHSLQSNEQEMRSAVREIIDGFQNKEGHGIFETYKEMGQFLDNYGVFLKSLLMMHDQGQALFEDYDAQRVDDWHHTFGRVCKSIYEDLKVEYDKKMYNDELDASVKHQPPEVRLTAKLFHKK